MESTYGAYGTDADEEGTTALFERQSEGPSPMVI